MDISQQDFFYYFLGETRLFMIFLVMNLQCDFFFFLFAYFLGDSFLFNYGLGFGKLVNVMFLEYDFFREN